MGLKCHREAASQPQMCRQGRHPIRLGTRFRFGRDAQSQINLPQAQTAQHRFVSDRFGDIKIALGGARWTLFSTFDVPQSGQRQTLSLWLGSLASRIASPNKIAGYRLPVDDFSGIYALVHLPAGEPAHFDPLIRAWSRAATWRTAPWSCR